MVVCFGVVDAEPVVFRRAGRWIVSGGGWRRPGALDLEWVGREGRAGIGGEGSGEGREVGGGVGRAFMVR